MTEALVDFHNHLIPSVDDGSQTIQQSLDALATMRDQGIRTIITTPHFRASLLARAAECDEYFARLEKGWLELLSTASREFPEIRLERGVELMLDSPHVSIADKRLRLAGGRFVLVEFPHLTIPPNSTRPLFDLKIAGLTPVIGHPERYHNVEDDLADLKEWKRLGAVLQVNTGSLLGEYGDRPRKIGWSCIRHGLADYLSSDFHARGDCTVSRAVKLLDSKALASQRKLLTETNGLRLLAGNDPLPVPPPEQRSPGRFARFFRRKK
ncbi:MAG TPA: CpsB/CapC family capsule biosynthesis tyrosine phosphatase [Gemmatimonadaceae bacterium]|nr:CpsB/CapC family capsule biosynthesis tyrosine phosphatase [Gemmatimonadaceae bacterium]